jgi:hypothetical protein
LDTVTLASAAAGIDWPNRRGLTLPTNSPQAAAVGDFNGDGIPDVALSAGGPSQPLVIFLGNANGTYTSAPTLTLPSDEYGFRPIAVADFNGDGIEDLAALDGDSNTVTILLGNGDGTFNLAATSPAVGSNPTQFAVGDFNGDGIPDLAVAAQPSNTLTILLGKGDGTFTATANSPAIPETADLQPVLNSIFRSPWRLTPAATYISRTYITTRSARSLQAMALSTRLLE